VQWSCVRKRFTRKSWNECTQQSIYLKMLLCLDQLSTSKGKSRQKKFFNNACSEARKKLESITHVNCDSLNTSKFNTLKKTLPCNSSKILSIGNSRLQIFCILLEVIQKCLYQNKISELPWVVLVLRKAQFL